MNLIETSLQIALRAYGGKTDKAGREYILHPLRVMAKMETDLERATALLHDVIEDSDITAEDLLERGITARLSSHGHKCRCWAAEARSLYRVLRKSGLGPRACCFTHRRPGFEDNIHVLRLATLDEQDLARIKKYHSA